MGEGPFPTELFDDDGQRLGERGHEFGTTTGVNVVVVGLTRFWSVKHVHIGCYRNILDQVDVLDGFETLKICVGYELMKSV